MISNHIKDIMFHILKVNITSVLNKKYFENWKTTLYLPKEKSYKIDNINKMVWKNYILN